MRFNKINYTRQKNKSDCFPTAIVNSFKHFGYKYSYKKYSSYMIDYLKTDEEGTTLRRIKQIAKLKGWPFTMEFKEDVCFCSLDRHLDSGNPVIFSETKEDKSGMHAFLLFKKDAKFYAINYYTNYTITILSPEKLLRMLKFYSYCIYLTEKT